MGGPYLRPAEEGGGTAVTYPFEIWHYRHLDGIGDDITLEFVDVCGCGEYRRTLNHSDKDAGKNIPNASPTDAESMGQSTKNQRLLDPEGIGRTLFSQNSTRFFERMEQSIALDRPPAVRPFEPDVKSIIHYNQLHFDVRVDFLRAPLNMVLMPITVQVSNRELTFILKDGIECGTVNIFGRVTTLTGAVAQTFEDTLSLNFPPEVLDKMVNNSALYWKALPLRPGRYRLEVVVKDVNGDKLGSFVGLIQPPQYGQENLSSSSLILADVMEPVAAGEVGGGNFVIGPTKVRPKVQTEGKPAKFRRDQRVNLWLQVYNLKLDESSRKPAASIEYQVVNTATHQPVIDVTESAAALDNTADQLTLKKTLALSSLLPGEYEVTVKINDPAQGRQIAPAARFTVE